MTDTAVRRVTRSGTFVTAQPWITTAARVGMAVVLYLAGWAKFTEPTPLKELAVSAYQILPDSMVTPVGVGLPILELVLAAMLLLGFATRFVGAAAAILMVIFIAGIISAWSRGLKIDCGCFGGGGVTKDPKYLQEILRDTGFFVLSLWIALLPKSKFAVDKLLGLYD
jgi:uncharacterized membrane protein YphA (DoxX/SURF4 family)